MGEKQQTLEGLRTRSISGSAIRGCKEVVKVAMRSLGGEKMNRCAEYVDEDAEEVGQIGDLSVFDSEMVDVLVKRKRGRRKGSTVKACDLTADPDSCREQREPSGDAEGKLAACDLDTAHWEKVKRFVQKGNTKAEHRCRCGTKGNHNYLLDKICEKLVGPKPR